VLLLLGTQGDLQHNQIMIRVVNKAS